ALVEQPDVLQAPASGEHEGAVGVTGVLPALVAAAVDEDPPEVAVDHGLARLAELGAGQARPGALDEGVEEAPKAVGLGERVVGGDHHPLAGALLQPAPHADVGRAAAPD